MLGCVLCFLGNEEMKFIGHSWLEANGVFGSSDFSIYLKSLFWSCYTIVTLGYGCIAIDTNLERIWCILCMICGAIMVDACVVAVISSIVNNADIQSGSVKI